MGLELHTSMLESAVNWARKFSLFNYPFVTACCGMEFMSTAAPKYDIARFGAEFPRFSPRQSDLLIIVGTITERQGPALRRIYEQMCEPKWVIAFGVCASTGGFYQNYSTMPGADQVVPVDVYIPGCPPRPEQVLDGLMLLMDRIQKGEGHSQVTIKAEKYDIPLAAIRPLQRTEQSRRASTPEKGRPATWRRSSSTPWSAHFKNGEIDETGSQHGNEWARVRRDAWLAVATFLRDDPTTAMNMISDLTSVDRFGHEPRFDVVAAPLLDRQEAPRAPVRRRARGRPDDRVGRLAVAGRQLVRARGVRPLRRALQGPPRPAAHPDVPGVRRAPAAQGLPQGKAPAAGAAADGQGRLRAGRTGTERLTEDRNGSDLMDQSIAPTSRRVVLGVSEPTDDALDAPDLPTEPMPLNMGPSHPAMHGTVRMVLDVEGEKITSADVQIGYLHRCFEKESESATWTQVFPYTDRLNYVSPMLNNVGYAMAVEKLLGIDKQIPERAQYIRVLVGEMSRITDHLTCLGAGAMELGAFTVFLYMLKAREWFYELLEEVSGARLTHSYMRIGGVCDDLTPTTSCRG